MVQCIEERIDLYIGETKQLLFQRMAQHNKGRGNSSEDINIKVLASEDGWVEKEEALFVRLEQPVLGKFIFQVQFKNVKMNFSSQFQKRTALVVFFLLFAWTCIEWLLRCFSSLKVQAAVAEVLWQSYYLGEEHRRGARNCHQMSCSGEGSPWQKAPQPLPPGTCTKMAASPLKVEIPDANNTIELCA